MYIVMYNYMYRAYGYNRQWGFFAAEPRSSVEGWGGDDGRRIAVQRPYLGGVAGGGLMLGFVFWAYPPSAEADGGRAYSGLRLRSSLVHLPMQMDKTAYGALRIPYALTPIGDPSARAGG